MSQSRLSTSSTGSSEVSESAEDASSQIRRSSTIARRASSSSGHSDSSHHTSWSERQARAARLLRPARRPPTYLNPAPPSYTVTEYDDILNAIRTREANNIPPFSDLDSNNSTGSVRSISTEASTSTTTSEDADILPSYRRASRRLAREQRLLASDPLEVEDPAGDPGSEHEDDDNDETFQVPPTYHNRGEDIPAYISSSQTPTSTTPPSYEDATPLTTLQAHVNPEHDPRPLSPSPSPHGLATAPFAAPTSTTTTYIGSESVDAETSPAYPMRSTS